jgi:integrase
MATIRARQRADGSIGYTAIIRIKKHGAIIHQEAQTFSREALARDWARRREVELEGPGAIALAKLGPLALGPLILRYIEEFEPVSRWGRSKGADLRKLSKMPIAAADVRTLDAPRLVMHVRERRAAGTGPATVANDLIWIGVVLRVARGVWGLQVSDAAVAQARQTCLDLRLIGRSKERDRTPTYEELQLLDAHFARQEAAGRADIPMRDVMWFAIYSARRQEEITRLLWSDNEEDRQLGIVRDLKHPEGSAGNHRAFRYTPQAWAIAARQPRVDARIFPFNPKSIGASFTRAVKFLGIEDLHFHDLRHEATTRLFERGLMIQEVAAHTLHESWVVLKRYTHIVKRGRVYDAPFLPTATSPTPT